MTPEAQRIIIAEALGRRYHKPTEAEVKSGSYYQYEPDFTSDLNAMRGAVLALRKQDFKAYMRYQQELIKQDGLLYTDAAAAQRSEAFLKAIGKWES